ncbi:MAG TPA: hypothetical protein VHI50_02520 [Micromonosporaceae bacterium]|nr:hypothetical protein [Micromonosporaceae bacterium]
MLFAEIAGWLGAGCLLAGYALVSARRIGPGWAYQLLNLAGSVGLAVNALTHRAWPSAALNGIWLVVALAALRGIAAPERPSGEPGS